MTEPIYRVLLVDDDREVLKMTGNYLRKKGLDPSLAGSASTALSLLERSSFQCIVLDVMMPDRDGFEVFPLIRKKSSAPILFLTARTDDEDRIRGLVLGADDYISKPCTLEELYLRIMINIRRHVSTRQQDGILKFPPLTIDLLQHRVFYNESEEILLSRREFDLLSLLARHAGETMTFEKIGVSLNGNFIAADRQNIMVTASRLRKKLEACPGLDNLIETAYGQGYRFRAYP